MSCLPHSKYLNGYHVRGVDADACDALNGLSCSHVRDDGAKDVDGIGASARGEISR